MRELVKAIERVERNFWEATNAKRYDGFSAVFQLIKSNGKNPDLEVVCGMYVKSPTYRNKSICVEKTIIRKNVTYQEFCDLLKILTARQHSKVTIEPVIPILCYIFYDVSSGIEGVYKLVKKAYVTGNWEVVGDGIGFHWITYFD